MMRAEAMIQFINAQVGLVLWSSWHQVPGSAHYSFTQVTSQSRSKDGSMHEFGSVQLYLAIKISTRYTI